MGWAQSLIFGVIPTLYQTTKGRRLASTGRSMFRFLRAEAGYTAVLMREIAKHGLILLSIAVGISGIFGGLTVLLAFSLLMDPTGNIPLFTNASGPYVVALGTLIIVVLVLGGLFVRSATQLLRLTREYAQHWSELA